MRYQVQRVSLTGLYDNPSARNSSCTSLAFSTEKIKRVTSAGSTLSISTVRIEVSESDTAGDQYRDVSSGVYRADSGLVPSALDVAETSEYSGFRASTVRWAHAAKQMVEIIYDNSHHCLPTCLFEIR